MGMIEFEYLDGASFILSECNDCGLVFQQETPNDFLMFKLYEEWIDPQLAYQRFLKGRNLVKQERCAGEIMMLIKYFKRSPDQLKFLDFGMGWSKWCLMAKAFCCEVYGTELSQARVEHANQLGVSILNWDELPDHQFDFINTEQVFEHIPKPLETLKHLTYALKPNGLIKISVPDGTGIKKPLKVGDWYASSTSKNSLVPVRPLEHINCFNHSSIVRMAERSGLELVKIPLGIQFAYTTNWSNSKETVKSLLRPIYRNVLSKGTYLFFRHKHKN
jgi:2-polyprenyl-3-methyl-5-hydroxy-6-metoxy-1,4-benzoquinol methylase